MSTKLACFQPCPIYGCIHILNRENVKVEIILERERGGRRKRNILAAVMNIVQYISWLDVWRDPYDSLTFFFVSSFSFLFTYFLSLVVCQTHSFLMEFQNASYIVRARKERERDGAAHIHFGEFSKIKLPFSPLVYSSSLIYW